MQEAEKSTGKRMFLIIAVVIRVTNGIPENEAWGRKSFQPETGLTAGVSGWIVRCEDDQYFHFIPPLFLTDVHR